MNRWHLSIGFWMGITALLIISFAGCAFKVVRPPPLSVKSLETGEVRVTKYPAYVVVHDSDSFWDGHQIKDNLIGLSEVEVIHWLDLAADGITPGPAHRPLENGIEWTRNTYARLPDCAPVRIVGSLFSALFLEKTTLLTGATKIIYAPTDPMSYFVFTRVIYLTDWVQETFGEANTGAGYLAPWEGPFIPLAATAPVNKGVDWTQSGAIALYVHVFHKVSVGLDYAIDGGEAAWGSIVGCFVWN